jgi:hypothetical protein
MFSAGRLLHEILTVISRMAVKATCVIIVAKVVSSSQTIEIYSVLFPSVDVHHV